MKMSLGVEDSSLGGDSLGEDSGLGWDEAIESGWVSVRPKVFEEKERHKFVFIVAWNDVEGKFAITCHNRTVQRRSTFLDPLLDCGPSDKNLKTGPPRGRTTWEKQPPKNYSRTVNVVHPNMSSWDIVVAPKAAEAEDVERVNLEEGEGCGHEDFSWAGLFSFQDLRGVHLELCAVNSDLEPCLPPFPEEQVGMWAAVFGAPVLPQGDREALCYQLQVYLGHALDTCGWRILSQFLFSERDDPDEYYESLSELQHRGFQDALERSKARMNQVLEKHRATDSMVALLQIYPEEDEAYSELLEATTQLYHFLLQPFRDMREVAMLRRQQIKISLETERLGPRRVDSLRKEDEEWQKKAQASVMSIQDLTVKFFETTTRALKGLYERMKADQKKFGKASWATTVYRMERLQFAVSRETLQLMRAKEICLEQRKHSLKDEMQSLCGGEDAVLRLDQLEALYYELQLQLYDIQSEVLRCEELLLTAQLQSLRRQMTERQDEVVYYDAFESPDAMKSLEELGTPPSPLGDEELCFLQQKTRQLEARRGRITSKKAYLKNKKEICINNHKQKSHQRQGDISDEGQSVAQVKQERQRTLDRLRSLRQRFPGQVTLKSTRLHTGLAVKRRGQEPVLQGAKVQTETDLRPEPSGTDPSDPPDNISAPFFSLSPLSPSSPSVVPPPPPPPPPPLEEQGIKKEKKQQASCGLVLQMHQDFPSPDLSESPALSLPPFSPRFFDSSQLLTARKKLRKTSSLDSSQWRRVSSPMDEVLASLKRGSFHLRKAELRVLAPDPDDDGNNILAQIRQGVRLRKVRARPEQQQNQRHGKSFSHSTDALTRSIHEALRRIKEASPDSESEDEVLPCTDWEN